MPLRTRTPQPAGHERLSYCLGQVTLGDERAFVALYNATAPHLLGVAMMLMKRRERAEEVLQEAYVNGWHNAGRYAQTDASPMSWLISIVRNKSLDHLRASCQSDTHTSFDDEATHHFRDSAPDALTLLAIASEQLIVRQCMASLDAPLRQSLALAFVLNTLSARARHRFVAVLRASAVAQRSVDSWHERLHWLSSSVLPIQPSERLWPAIRLRTIGTPRLRLGRAAAWWLPALGIAAGALAAIAVVRIDPRLMGVEPASTVVLAPSYVGILSDSAGSAVAVVSSLRHGRLLSIKLLKPLAICPAQVARLWALPSDGRRAFPVDVLPSAQKGTIELLSSSDKIFSNVARLAVSIESLSVQSVNSFPDTYHLSGPRVKLW